MSDNARFDPRFDPAFQPGYEGPIASKPVVAPNQQPARVSEPPVALPAVVAPPVSQESVEQPSGGVNPFLIVLGAIAAALVGGGLFLTSRLREFYLNTQQGSDFDFATGQVLIYGAALVIMLGIA
ncbi:MAG: hypothetical protein H7226_13545, partial [Salinibacterium sp.]|nr:hypothetical protein [Salinibacterium sp.]